MKKPAIKPKDAATLVLVRRDRPQPQVLMGHRSTRHVFMPNTFVFPGGRVDREDGQVQPGTELRSEVELRLTRQATPRRARALALAAVRETFEETGLILGRPANGVDMARIPETWRPFYATGIEPALDLLDYVFRAITPPRNVRRYHVRFFIADYRHVEGELGGSGELVDLQWIPIDDALAMPNTPSVTAHVLEEVARLLRDTEPTELPAAHRVPFFRRVYGKDILSSD